MYKYTVVTHFSPVKLNFKYTLEMDKENDHEIGNDGIELFHWIQGLGIGIVTKGEVNFKLNYFNRNYEFFSDSDITNKIMGRVRSGNTKLNELKN